MRHAKSSWGDPSLPDFDRPLNDRGKRDAPFMAEKLKNRIETPDLFITSPAKRAKKTCKIFCEAFGYSEKKILVVDQLYLAPLKTYYEILQSLDKSQKRVIIFSHNPGISDFASSLCEGVTVSDMPTCSIFAVKAKISGWDDFRLATKEFEFFDYPKLHPEL